MGAAAIPILIATTVASGVYSAQQQKAAGKAANAEAQIAANREGDAARAREIERRRALLRAIASQNAAAGAGGVDQRPVHLHRPLLDHLAFAQAHRADPEWLLPAWHMALLYHALGYGDAAQAALARCGELLREHSEHPKNTGVVNLHNRAYMHLALGHWAQGFECYEYRLQDVGHALGERARTRVPEGLPRWTHGDPPKRLAVFVEQGAGDMFMILPFVRHLINAGVEVTLELFNRFGEPNVSTTLISAELNISTGNLYYHYPAKDLLVDRLFDRYEQALVNNDVATLDAIFHDDPRTIRYGGGENLYGFAEIAAFRSARSPACTAGGSGSGPAGPAGGAWPRSNSANPTSPRSKPPMPASN